MRIFTSKELENMPIDEVNAYLEKVKGSNVVISDMDAINLLNYALHLVEKIGRDLTWCFKLDGWEKLTPEYRNGEEEYGV